MPSPATSSFVAARVEHSRTIGDEHVNNPFQGRFGSSFTRTGVRVEKAFQESLPDAPTKYLTK
jgi:hypothetical protein